MSALPFRAVFLLLVGMAFLAAGLVWAQNEPPGPQRWARPNVELPAHVAAEPGKLTLFADFEHPEDDAIPLYVVNRTGSKTTFSHQDGDFLLKLERQLPDGSWERVQSHQYSFCGNSYGMQSLPPGMHARLPGVRIAKGEAATVRYSCYGIEEMSSNTGSGLIDPAEFQAARIDALSLRNLPEDFLGLTSTSFHPSVSESEGDFSRKLATLELAQAAGNIPAVREWAAKWMDSLAALPKPSAEQKLVLKNLRRILALPWEGHPDLDRLLRRCLTAVQSTGPAAFGTPEREKDAAWRLLTACVGTGGKPKGGGTAQPKPADPALRKTTLLLAAERAGQASAEEARGIASVLSLTTLADEILPDTVFETLLASPEESLVRVAASTLARREQWDRLAGLAAPLPPANQLVAFQELAFSGTFLESSERVRRAPGEGKEAAFWNLVLREQTLTAISAISVRTWNGNPFDRSSFTPLFDYWNRETRRSKSADADFPATDTEAAASVRFLAAWGHGADTPLLQALLDYRGYREQISHASQDSGPSQEILTRVFDVRRAAAEALKKRGEPVPADLVLEIEVARTPPTEKR